MKTKTIPQFGFKTRHLAPVASMAAILCLMPPLTHAERAVQAWLQTYNGPGNGDDRAGVVAVDASNNVVVTGTSWGGSSSNDWVTIKYSSAGVPLWTNRYNGPWNGVDEARAMAVDASNDVIVSGFATDSGGHFGDYVTVKYSAGGVPLWTNRYNGPVNSDDVAYALAVDKSNNVIVTGYSYGIGSGSDYATIKYTSAGVPLWTNRYNLSITDEAHAVAVDRNNDVLVTGWSWTADTSQDFATIKYSSAGIPLWTNRYSGQGYGQDDARVVLVDSNNDVIVAGTSTSANHVDYAVVKYSSAGVPLWTNRYSSPGDTFESLQAAGIDSKNDVLVTGYCIGEASNRRYVTIKYSSAGAPLWTNSFFAWDAQAYAMAVDAKDNVIVAGYAGLSGAYNFLTIKYSGAGMPLWTNTYTPGPAYIYVAPAIAMDHSGNAIVTGVATDIEGNDDLNTIKYICVPDPVLTALPPTDGTFRIRVDNVLESGTLVVEASTNLADWAPVFTNTTPTNVVFYTESEASNGPTRFYRAFQFQ